MTEDVEKKINDLAPLLDHYDALITVTARPNLDSEVVVKYGGGYQTEDKASIFDAICLLTEVYHDEKAYKESVIKVLEDQNNYNVTTLISYVMLFKSIDNALLYNQTNDVREKLLDIVNVIIDNEASHLVEDVIALISNKLILDKLLDLDIESIEELLMFMQYNSVDLI